MNNFTSDNIGSVSQDDIYPPFFDDERKYRGAVSHKLHLPHNVLGNNVDANIELYSASNQLLVNSSIKNKVSCINHVVPDAPLYLVPSHFKVNTCLDGLMSRVHNILGQMSGVSCEFLYSVYEVILLILFYCLLSLIFLFI